MSQPPSYEDAIRELEDLKARGISSDDLVKAHSAMANEAAKPSTTSSVLEEIRALASRAIAMDKSFARIKVDLGRVDAEEYLDKSGKPIEKLQPTWVGYQRRFTALLWGSRNAATVAEVYIKDFVEVIIPEVKDTSVSLSDKKASLSEFINRRIPNSSTTGSGTRSQEFTSLRNDVEAFTTKFLEFAKERDAELTSQIKSLNDRITALDTQIKQADQLILELGIALGATGAGVIIGVIAAGSALGPVAPIAIASILIAGIGAMIGMLSKIIATIVASNKARAERYSKQAEVDRLNEQLGVLQGLKSALERMDRDVKQVYSRLDDFSSIWNMVNHDAQLVGDLLSNSPGGTLNDGILWKIELMEATYKALQVGLREYATFINADVVQVQKEQ